MNDMHHAHRSGRPVNYRCDFAFPSGWRGCAVRLLMSRELAWSRGLLASLERGSRKGFDDAASVGSRRTAGLSLSPFDPKRISEIARSAGTAYSPLRR